MLSYFSHDVNSRKHWKFVTLRKVFGFEGEGRFWVLNCIIAEEENCRLDLSREAKLEAIADELQMRPSDFKHFLDFLHERVELIKKDKDGYYTDRVDEIKARVEGNRKRQRTHYQKRKVENIDDSYGHREFFKQQFELAKSHDLQMGYFHFVANLYNISRNGPNVIDSPAEHILNLPKQMTFEEYVKLRSYCKARNTNPLVLVESWMNNKKYSKGKVSVYATLRSWASREPIKQTNL